MKKSFVIALIGNFLILGLYSPVSAQSLASSIAHSFSPSASFAVPGEKFSINSPGLYPNGSNFVATASDQGVTGFISKGADNSFSSVSLRIKALDNFGADLGEVIVNFGGDASTGTTVNTTLDSQIQHQFISQANGISLSAMPNFGPYQIATLTFSLERDIGLQRNDAYWLELELDNLPKQLIAMQFSANPGRFDLSVELNGTNGTVPIYQAGIDPEPNWFSPGSLFAARNPQNGEASLVLVSSSRQTAYIAANYNTESMIWIEDPNGQAVYYTSTHYLNNASIILVLGLTEEPFLSAGTTIHGIKIPGNYLYYGSTYHFAYWSEHPNGDVLAGSYVSING